MYDWSKPVSWAEFKKYPQDTQKECLQYFAEKWGCSCGMFAKMAGTADANVSIYLRNHGISGILRRLPKKADAAAFEGWLNSQGSEPDEEKLEVIEQPTEEAPQTVEQPEAPVLQPAKQPKPQEPQVYPIFIRTMEKGRLYLSGPADEIAQSIAGIFKNAKVRMTVDFEVIREPEKTGRKTKV